MKIALDGNKLAIGGTRFDDRRTPRHIRAIPSTMRLLFLTIALLGAFGVRAKAAEANSETPSQPDVALATTLTLDRLFSSKEFDAEPTPQIRWSKHSSSYFTFDEAESGEGRDLVRNDPATGQRQVVVPSSAFIPEPGAEPLTVDSFEFSPDESKLLIFTNSKRVWRRNTRGDYWVLDTASYDLNKLGGDSHPATLMFAKFSPDGSRIAYVRENNIYVQELRGMGISAVTTDGSTTLINGTSDWVNEEELSLRDCFRWSPDSQRLLFWQFDTSGVSEFHLLNNTEETYPRIISFAYPKVGETNSAARLGVVSADGGKVTWLQVPGDPREHYLPHAEWTPDGSRLLIQQFNRLQTENRVMLADPRTGLTSLVATETDAAWLENENPVRWWEAGKSLLWLSERTGWRHAYKLCLDGTPLTQVTRGEFDVIEVAAVQPHDGWLYFMASPGNATQRYLYRTRVDGGEPERISPISQPGWHEYDISPDGNWAVHTYSSFTTPPVVNLIRLRDHSVVRVLAGNYPLRERLAALNRPAAEFFQVDVGDDITLDGWCLKPPEFDAGKKYPLLIHVYGEPHGQTVRDAWGGPRGLWHWMLAQQGCVVASIDNRGTNVPRGRDWRKCVHRQIGILASHEQATATRALLEQWSFVEPTRIGIWGWSGGGSMSLNAIFRYPDLYRTAIAVAPNADQGLYDTIYQERYMGLPDDNVEGYREGSPLTHAHQLRGNLLLVHGTGDDNCHYQGTERLINKLIARGKQFTVMPYPNRSHSINEGPNTVRHFWGYLTRYIQDNLLSEHAPAPESVAETRVIRGWMLHIHRELLATEPQLTERAVELLDQQLEEITGVVPGAAVAELKKVPLYFSPEYPGMGPKAEFHPDSGWLRANSRDPAMAEGVEFTNIRIFEQETIRMPNFALHELAHAYHFRVLPGRFGNSRIKDAFEKALADGKYERVERRNGNNRSLSYERAYAMSNPMEYFAECTEAYFSTNDFFPYNREDLRRHDPEMFELLGKLWTTPEGLSP
jgi:dipeptidyl-peptidase 4